jgi:nitrate reductase gamma subunit
VTTQVNLQAYRAHSQVSATIIGAAGTSAMKGISVYFVLGVLALAGLVVLWLDRGRRRRIARLEAH